MKRFTPFSALLPLVAVTFFAAPAASQDRKPNVIVILADDLGFADLGVQGGKDIPTPNIDSLAKNGTRFTAGLCLVPLLQSDAGRPQYGPLPDAIRPRI